jgi:hypothetical protein
VRLDGSHHGLEPRFTPPLTSLLLTSSHPSRYRRFRSSSFKIVDHPRRLWLLFRLPQHPSPPCYSIRYACIPEYLLRSAQHVSQLTSTVPGRCKATKEERSEPKQVFVFEPYPQTSEQGPLLGTTNDSLLLCPLFVLQMTHPCMEMHIDTLQRYLVCCRTPPPSAVFQTPATANSIDLVSVKTTYNLRIRNLQSNATRRRCRSRHSPYR